jgi:hypothetical protein
MAGMRRVTVLAALLFGISLAYPGGANVGINVGRDLVPSTADECSETHQYWIIDELQLKVYDFDNGGTMGTFGFKSFHPANNATIECLAQDVDLSKLDNGSWNKCKTPEMEFRFNFSDVSLTIKETWTCPGSPGLVSYSQYRARLGGTMRESSRINIADYLIVLSSMRTHQGG